MSELIKLTGLWKNQGKNGKPYLSGGLGYAGKLVIFQNDHKQKDTDPDYIAYMAAKPKQDDQANEKDEIPF